MKTFIPANAASDIVIFALATFGTFLAQLADRPITAVLVYLSGVILIATHSGLRHALIAAIAASLIFNFWLSEPAYEFGLTTADELIPLIAFNLCAIVTGTLVGRLKDSASLANKSQADTAFLLTVSDRLQRAVKVENIEKELRSAIATQSVENVEIYVSHDDHFIRPSTGKVMINRLEPFLSADSSADVTIVELKGAGELLGIAKFTLANRSGDRQGIPNLQSLSTLLGLAVERCILLGRIAQVEADQKSEELKDAILSSVSHDLRTPLTAIEAAAGALSSDEVNLPLAEQKKLLQSILSQCRRLNRYTADLLDMGRIQAGISKERFETVELADIVNVALKHATAQAENVTIERQFASQPISVSANAVMLEQAVFNVIENAVKFIDHPGEGNPTITITLAEEEGCGRISISDNGPGISGDHVERVFDRFFKKPAEKARHGSGLGLFIARGFIEAFGGTIKIVDPQISKVGTRVEISLPIVPQHADLGMME